MKRIYDHKEAKSVSAYIVLNPEGKHVGTVRAVFKDSGNCYAEVLNFAASENQVHTGKAGGYGYDKFTAAISGGVIDGHTISNHCAGDIPTPECGFFPVDFEPPKGYTLCNYRDGGYRNCYKRSGLDYLRDLGYQVIQAI